MRFAKIRTRTNSTVFFKLYIFFFQKFKNWYFQNRLITFDADQKEKAKRLLINEVETLMVEESLETQIIMPEEVGDYGVNGVVMCQDSIKLNTLKIPLLV